jgi:pyrroloquinoline quinone biosynthesis protein B
VKSAPTPAQKSNCRMLVKILGSAAGGGFPQWNCACTNCRRVRNGTLRGKPRTQSQIALTGNGTQWCLLNASPDLRAQILANPELQPNARLRESPIMAVVLTSADVDHVAGLLHLREFQPLRIFSTESVARILTEDNTIFRALQRGPEQVSWQRICPGEGFELESAPDSDTGIRCEPLALPGDFPTYAGRDRRSARVAGEAVLGLVVESSDGRRMIFMPGVAELDDSLLAQLESCDDLLFDGTFWSEDELIRILGNGPTASEMGHMPISGPKGSLARLGYVKRPRKIFIHVNNTNPILDEESPERGEVVAAGWEVAEDGWEIRL